MQAEGDIRKNYCPLDKLSEFKLSATSFIRMKYLFNDICSSKLRDPSAKITLVMEGLILNVII